MLCLLTTTLKAYHVLDALQVQQGVLFISEGGGSYTSWEPSSLSGPVRSLHLPQK